MEKSKLSFQSFAVIAVSAIGKLPPVLSVWKNLNQIFFSTRTSQDVGTLHHMMIVAFACLMQEFRELLIHGSDPEWLMLKIELW